MCRRARPFHVSIIRSRRHNPHPTLEVNADDIGLSFAPYEHTRPYVATVSLLLMTARWYHSAFGTTLSLHDSIRGHYGVFCLQIPLIGCDDLLATVLYAVRPHSPLY